MQLVALSLTIIKDILTHLTVILQLAIIFYSVGSYSYQDLGSMTEIWNSLAKMLCFIVTRIYTPHKYIIHVPDVEVMYGSMGSLSLSPSPSLICLPG